MKKLRSVLAGVDFGGAGEDGARWVAAHFAPRDVTLLHVVHIPKPPRFLQHLHGQDAELRASAMRGAEARIDDVARDLGRSTGIRFRGEVRVGRPAEVIADEATRRAVDLIVLGPHDGREHGWKPLGSTVAQVLHQAKVPTFVARGRLPRAPTRVLAAIDDSDASGSVLAWLQWLVTTRGATGFALHVVDYPVSLYGRGLTATRARSVENQLEENATGWLRGKLTAAGLSEECEANSVVGAPASRIMEALERLDIDLLLMGTHGAGAISRLLIGSVADSLVRRSPCPVLMLPETG